MDLTNVVGLIAGALATIAFLPQVMKVVRTRSTRDVSLKMFVIFTTGVLFWLWYGYLLNAVPILITNVIMLVLNSIIIYYKIRCDRMHSCPR